MALGKLGIRLIAIGRWLQIRYANWNSEFRLKFEIGSLGTDHVANFHLSDRLTSEIIVSFESPGAQPTRQTGLVKDLFAIAGVCRIWLHPYEILIRKGEVFSWEELRPDIEATILKHLTAHALVS